MSIIEASNNQPIHAVVPLVDALSKWSAETPKVQARIGEIRLDANDKILIPFTSVIGEATLHYADFPSLRGYVRCNGAGCVLCKIGRRVETRDLLPVYDPLDKQVGVLPISPNIRPGALRPQLAAVLEQIQDGQRVLMIVSKPDRARFVVKSLPLGDGVEDGASAIGAFQDEFEKGEVDLGSVFQRIGNSDLATIPEIALSLTALGHLS